MLEGLTTWAKERPTVAALMGGGLVVAVALLLLVLGGGEDVAPVVGSPAPPAQTEGTPAANGAAQPVPGEDAAPGTTVADGGGGDDAGSVETVPQASEQAQEVARQHEVGLNAGLAPVNATGAGTPVIGTDPVSTDRATPAGVANAGRELEQAADDIRACIAEGTKGDVFECLAVKSEAIQVEKIHERAPQGAVITLTAVDGQVVKLSFRGETECRLLGDGTSCNAWDAGIA